MTVLADRPAAALLRTLVVDDHQLLAHSLALALGTEGVSCTVAPLVTRDHLLAHAAEERPQLVLLDLELGGELGNGADLVTELLRCGARVIVVTASTDPVHIGTALENGASGVISKSLPFESLLGAVLAAARGEELLTPAERLGYLDAARRRRDTDAATLAPFERLTGREQEVLRALADGLNVTTVARRCHVSEATVRSQVRAILTKLGVCSQLEAVALVRRSGWS